MRVIVSDFRAIECSLVQYNEYNKCVLEFLIHKADKNAVFLLAYYDNEAQSKEAMKNITMNGWVDVSKCLIDFETRDVISLAEVISSRQNRVKPQVIYINRRGGGEAKMLSKHINKPENCINIDESRKLFIGFDKEDYFYLRDLLINEHYRTFDDINNKRRKMHRMNFFIVLHYDMNFINTFKALDILIKRVRYYNKDNQKQIRVNLLTLGQEYMKTHFIKLLRELDLIGNGVMIDGSEHKVFVSNGYKYDLDIKLYLNGDKINITRSIEPFNIEEISIYRHIYNPDTFSHLDDEFNDLLEYISQTRPGLICV